MLNLLPRNPARREWTISQLLGIASGAVLMLGLIGYMLFTRPPF